MIRLLRDNGWTRPIFIHGSLARLCEFYEAEGVSLKCADAGEAAILIEVGRAERAPYLTRGGWVMIRFGDMDANELRERLTTSYLVVRCGLTKKVQASLAPEPVA